MGAGAYIAALRRHQQVVVVLYQLIQVVLGRGASGVTAVVVEEHQQLARRLTLGELRGVCVRPQVLLTRHELDAVALVAAAVARDAAAHAQVHRVGGVLVRVHPAAAQPHTARGPLGILTQRVARATTLWQSAGDSLAANNGGGACGVRPHAVGGAAGSCAPAIEEALRLLVLAEGGPPRLRTFPTHRF